MAEVVFIAPGLQHAYVWAKEWGFTKKEIRVAMSHADLVYLERNFLPSQLELYVCTGISREMHYWIEMAEKAGCLVTDAEADFPDGYGEIEWNEDELPTWNIELVEKRKKTIFPKSTARQFRFDLDPTFDLSQLLDIEP